MSSSYSSKKQLQEAILAVASALVAYLTIILVILPMQNTIAANPIVLTQLNWAHAVLLIGWYALATIAVVGALLLGGGIVPRLIREARIACTAKRA